MHRSMLIALFLFSALIGRYGRSDEEGKIPQPVEQGFTDVTMESGIAGLVTQHYDKHPRWWLSGLHLVDLDGDGELDLFLSAHGRGDALAALGDGAGRFSLAPGSYPPSEIHLAYDVDEDGKADLTMTFQDGGGKWWLNRGEPGLLAFEGTKIERGTNTGRRQAMIDLDRDGQVDWLRGVPGRIIFERGDGKGSFVQSREIPVGDSERAEVLCLPIDIDLDGFIDLLVEWGHYGSSPSNSRIFHNDGKMNFTDCTTECGLARTGMSIKGAGDVNRDGLPDLFVLENKVPEIYLNDGQTHFIKKANAVRGMEQATRPAYASWGLAVVVDIDNDGISDILWNGRHFLWVLRGTGDGHFEYRNRAWGIKDMSAAAVDDGLCFGDVDGDGDLDIIGYTSISDQRRIAAYRNDLPKQHWLNVQPIGRPGNRGAAGAKIRLLAPETGELLAYEQVCIYDSQAAASYYNYTVSQRHFGLGQRQVVDVSVEFHPSGQRVQRKSVAADTTVEIVEPLPK